MGWNLKPILSYLKSAPSNLSKWKISGKNKCLNFGPKMPYLGIFGLELENNIIMFKVSTLEFVKLRNIVKK